MLRFADIMKKLEADLLPSSVGPPTSQEAPATGTVGATMPPEIPGSVSEEPEITAFHAKFELPEDVSVEKQTPGAPVEPVREAGELVHVHLAEEVQEPAPEPTPEPSEEKERRDFSAQLPEPPLEAIMPAVTAETPAPAETPRGVQAPPSEAAPPREMSEDERLLFEVESLISELKTGHEMETPQAQERALGVRGVTLAEADLLRGIVGPSLGEEGRLPAEIRIETGGEMRGPAGIGAPTLEPESKAIQPSVPSPGRPAELPPTQELKREEVGIPEEEGALPTIEPARPSFQPARAMANFFRPLGGVILSFFTGVAGLIRSIPGAIRSLVSRLREAEAAPDPHRTKKTLMLLFSLIIIVLWLITFLV